VFGRAVVRYLEVIVISASKLYGARVCYWNYRSTPGIAALIATGILVLCCSGRL